MNRNDWDLDAFIGKSSKQHLLDDMTSKLVVFPKRTPCPSTRNVIFRRSGTFFLDLLCIDPDDSEGKETMEKSYMIGPFQSHEGQMEVNVEVKLENLLGFCMDTSNIMSATIGGTSIPVVRFDSSFGDEKFLNLVREEIETTQKANMELNSSLSMETKMRIEIEKTLENERIEQQKLLESKAAIELQCAQSKILLETPTKQHEQLQTALQDKLKGTENSLDMARSEILRLHEALQIGSKTIEDQRTEFETLREINRMQHEEIQADLQDRLKSKGDSLDRAMSENQRLQEELQIEREERENASKIFENQIFFANEHRSEVERKLADSESHLETTRKQHDELEINLRNEIADHEKLHEELQIERELEKVIVSKTIADQILLANEHITAQLEQFERLQEINRNQHEELQTNLRNEVNKIKSSLDEETKRRIEIEKTVEIAHKVVEERDNDFKEADEWRQKMIEGQSCSAGVNFKIFSLSEIEKATNNFDNSHIIGEGGYGCVYRGSLRDINVAIKIPKHDPNSQLGATLFRQEVEILTMVRHPNLVSFIGACLKAQALVFEFIPNGSLNSYLSNGKNDKTPPWQERIRIASEICSAIMFLHSIPPHGVAHGDLKPENVLLDSNFVCKLADFGISRKLQLTESTFTPLHLTANPMGTFCYFDPEYLCSGQLTSQSDIFAFGAILLQLITGRQPQRLNQIVRDALNDNKLDTIVDPSAGEWPIEEANKLASLGLYGATIQREKEGRT